jgi:hypothetical protein
VHKRDLSANPKSEDRFKLYTAAFKEGAECLPNDDKRSDKLARLKKISDVDNAYVDQM